jgi:hypothetical protein
MLRKKSLHDKAVSLRKEGFSYNEIKAIVPVGNGTISRWCRCVELTEKQVERIKDKKRDTPLIKNLREHSQKDKKDALLWAKKKIKPGKFKNNELLISGAMLYWAEGHNTDKNKSAIFTNTDAEMIKVIMRFFREIVMVSDNKIKVMVRISENGNIKQAEKYWSEIVGLSKERFQKPEILKINKNSTSLLKHPNGICRVSVYDVSARRKIQNAINLLKQK